jgi:hypothetical protein
VKTNWPPKALKPFIDKGLSMVPNSVKVVAKNSPYKGRKIVVYTAETIEALISAYALSLAHRALRALPFWGQVFSHHGSTLSSNQLAFLEPGFQSPLN